MGWKERKANRKKIASERIKELLEFSKIHIRDNDLSTSSIKTAVAISKRHKIRITSKFKRSFCKKCFTVFIPGKTVRIRIGKGKVTFTCLKCGHIKRIPYNKEKKYLKKVKMENEN